MRSNSHILRPVSNTLKVSILNSFRQPYYSHASAFSHWLIREMFFYVKHESHSWVYRKWALSKAKTMFQKKSNLNKKGQIFVFGMPNMGHEWIGNYRCYILWLEAAWPGTGCAEGFAGPPCRCWVSWVWVIAGAFEWRWEEIAAVV